MRALIPLIVLGSLLILAGQWQGRNPGRTAAEPSPSRGAVTPPLGEGWSQLILGRPSGAEPLRRPESNRSAPLPPIDTEPLPEPTPTPSDTRYVVQPNDALGLICQAHYDVRPLSSVVAAVAEYNDLSSVHAIHSGDVLLLPDPAILFQDR